MYISHKKERRYKAILFDFDGVLGETMEDNYRAWQYALSKYDMNIDKTEYFLLEGMSTKEIAAYYLRQRAKSLELIDTIAELKEKYYMRNNEFRIYSGVEQLLLSLIEKGYLLGIVSGVSYARLCRSMSHELLNEFNVVVTGNGDGKCKPHPEPYLSAARKLGVKPFDCLVIENSPLGIESAVKAGMDCVAICSTLNRKYLEKADNVIGNVVDIVKLL